MIFPPSVATRMPLGTSVYLTHTLLASALVCVCVGGVGVGGGGGELGFGNQLIGRRRKKKMCRLLMVPFLLLVSCMDRFYVPLNTKVAFNDILYFHIPTWV